MSSKSCRSCDKPLTLESRSEDKVGAAPINVCLHYIMAAVRELKKEDERHYYGLESGKGDRHMKSKKFKHFKELLHIDAVSNN